MEKTQLFAALALCASLTLLFQAGCSGTAARRDARRAAFEPLRPDPAYRLLPDRPIHFRPDHKNRPAPVPAEEMLQEPPVIWTARRLEDAGLKPGATRYHDQTAEVYFVAALPFNGELVAMAVDGNGDEVGRVRVPVAFQNGDARFVEFAFAKNLPMNQIKVISVDRMAGE